MNSIYRLSHPINLRRTGLSFLIALIWLSSGCASLVQSVLQEPKIELSRVWMREAGPKGATLVFALKVDNPNAIELFVDRLAYSISLGGQKLTDSTVENRVSVPAQGTGLVEIPLTIEFSKIMTAMTAALTGAPVKYDIAGTAEVGLFKLPFARSGEIKIDR
jgi:LEA14-like dessication related protein